MTGSCLYSQVLTLKIKFMRSDCFFLQSSSRYLQAPMWQNIYSKQYQLINISASCQRPNQLCLFQLLKFYMLAVSSLIETFQKVHINFCYIEQIKCISSSIIAMIHQPNSPNVFDAIYISNSRKNELSSQNCSRSEFFFNKRLESIRQFIDLLEDNPENLPEITEIELKWERTFFKNQLKAALYLNYSLIKLHCEKNDELKQIKEELLTRNTTQKKKNCLQPEVKAQLSFELIENSHEHSNGATPMKKRLIKEAFEAEKRILNAKHHIQCEELRKLSQHRDCMLRASKEENQYLRSQLIKMSQKNTTLNKQIKEVEQQQKRRQEDIKKLNMIIKQLQESEKKWNHQKRLNQLNCSPIGRSGQNFALQEGEISFNNDFFNQNIIENNQLKKQLEDIQLELKELKDQKSMLLQKSHLENEHEEVMKESRRLFLVSLENQYHQIKQELQERVLQIELYKKIVYEAKQFFEMTSNKQKEQIERLKVSISCKEQAKSIHECSNCLILTKDNENLRNQLEQTQSKNHELRRKFDKTLNLELLQRRQWDAFLNDLKTEKNQ